MQSQGAGQFVARRQAEWPCSPKPTARRSEMKYLRGPPHLCFDTPVLLLASRVLPVLAVLALGTTSRADQIVVEDHNYRGAKVVGLRDGLVEFHEADGGSRRVDVAAIKLLVLDHGRIASDFNRAEQYVSQGKPIRAIVRYRRALRVSEGLWSDLIVARLLRACDRAQRMGEQARYFVRVVESPALRPAAGRLMPQYMPTTRTETVAQALRHLEAALARNREPQQTIPLALYRYDILRRVQDTRAPAAAEEITALRIPPWLRTERVYSIILAALAGRLKKAVTRDVLADLDRAMEKCPLSLLPSFLLLKGRALLRTASTREDMIRASWPFLRVAIHMPDDPRAADGLYGAAEALEKIGRPEKAMELLRECLAHKPVSEQTQKLARKALARLETKESTPG